jgi:hypothetical protein
MLCGNRTETQFRRQVQRVFEMCSDRPIVLDTTDQVPPDAGIGRVRMVAEAFTRWNGVTIGALGVIEP